MEEKTYLLNMFSDYEPPESLKNAISQAAIVAADLGPVARRITMTIRCEHYIPQRMLDVASADIRKHIANGEDISNDVPAAVAQYIKERGLCPTGAYGGYCDFSVTKLVVECARIVK